MRKSDDYLVCAADRHSCWPYNPAFDLFRRAISFLIFGGRRDFFQNLGTMGRSEFENLTWIALVVAAVLVSSLLV